MIKENNYITEDIKDNLETDARNEIINKNIFKQNAFGVVELILILVVAVGLVLIFKNEIEALVNSAISSLTRDAGKIL